MWKVLKPELYRHVLMYVLYYFWIWLLEWEGALKYDLIIFHKLHTSPKRISAYTKFPGFCQGLSNTAIFNVLMFNSKNIKNVLFIHPLFFNTVLFSKYLVILKNKFACYVQKIYDLIKCLKNIF